MKKHHEMNPLMVALPSASGKKARSWRLHKRRILSGVFIVVFGVIGVTLLTFSRAATNVTTVRSGPWSSPSTWSTGAVPSSGDLVTINAGHDVLFDVTSARVSGINLNGTLTFDRSKSTTLESSKNVVVKGQLVMNPSSPTVNQTLRFVNVNESAFVGGGMNVLDTDTGLWVMDSGQLYTKGTPRSGWLNTTAGINSGSTQLTLEKAPTGWRVGDKIVIAPTDFGQNYDHFHETTITAISGATVTFANAAPRNYPKVNNRWTPEVMNVTRNVTIEGTQSGRAHIFIRSNKPQFIRYANIQFMGPRAHTGTDQTGRYGIHFHMGGKGSIGSIVEGTVVQKTTNHAFVPHSSTGITFRDTVAYDTFEDPYWWDPGEETDDVLYDHAMAAKSTWLSSKDGDKYRNSGYFLAAGDGNEVRNSVAVGTGTNDGGGYWWNNESDGLWTFTDNIAHNNNANGIAVWQNTPTPHTLIGFASYHNRGRGIDHGAYNNNYLYENGFVYGNQGWGVNAQIDLHAVSRQVGLHFINVEIDSANRTNWGIHGCSGAVPGSTDLPIIFSDSPIKGHKQHGVYMHGERLACDIDFVRSPISGNQFYFAGGATSDAQNGSRIRYQNGSDVFQVTYPSKGQGSFVTAWNANKQSISSFAPPAWGTGTGMKVSYYDGTNFNTLRAVEIRPYLDLEGWNEDPPHNFLTTPRASIRVEGDLEALFTGPTKVAVSNSDGARLWINDQLVINDWNDGVLEERSATVNMVQGQRYKLKAEFYEDDVPTDGQIFKGSARLLWQPSGMIKAIIPAPQMYPAQPLPNFDPVIAPDPALPAYATGGQPQPQPEPEPEPEPEPQPTPDTTVPTVSLTSPASNAMVSGTINISANATDNVGVTKVEFYVDGALKSTDKSAAYSYSFDTKSVANGAHTIMVKAYDAAGNSRSATTTVTVNNQTTPPPTQTPTYQKEDINQDGLINLIDFSLLASKFGQTGNLGGADINNDGKVNLLDFSLLAAKFGQ